MDFTRSLHDKVDRLLHLPEVLAGVKGHVERVFDGLLLIAKGIAAMTASQDRFNAAMVDLRSLVETAIHDNAAKLSEKDAEIAGLKDQLAKATAAPVDTSATDKVFDDATDMIESLKAEIGAKSDSVSGGAGNDTVPSISDALPGADTTSGGAAPSDSIPGAPGQDSVASMSQIPAPGGSPSDALASGSTGATAPSPPTASVGLAS